MIKVFFAQNNTNLVLENIYGYTSLHFAAAISLADMLKETLNKSGIHDNETDDEGKTPLHFALKNSDVECLYKLFSVSNIHVHTQNDKIRIPQHYTDVKGHLEYIKSLIAVKNIEVNAKDSPSNTSLSFSQYSDYPVKQLICYLLLHGAR